MWACAAHCVAVPHLCPNMTSPQCSSINSVCLLPYGRRTSPCSPSWSCCSWYGKGWVVFEFFLPTCWQLEENKALAGLHTILPSSHAPTVPSSANVQLCKSYGILETKRNQTGPKRNQTEAKIKTQLRFKLLNSIILPNLPL
jgi:hypothetical protein